MATQNIEMNLYNGTDYTVLNPKTSASQVTYSNTNTSSIITGTNTQTAIDQLFQSVSNGKSSIASAITGKGISTSSTASFSTMATNIGKIPTGVDTSDTTAVASNVLSGKTFYGSSGSKITGSMTNRGAVSRSLNAGGSYTIPSGYHNGSGEVTANSLSSQTSATATASDILSGKTAWVNGSKITGTGNFSSMKQVYYEKEFSPAANVEEELICNFKPNIIMMSVYQTSGYVTGQIVSNIYNIVAYHFNNYLNINEVIYFTNGSTYALGCENVEGTYPNFTVNPGYGTSKFTITETGFKVTLNASKNQKFRVLCSS